MNMNKIIAILGIALLAIVTVGAASAAEVTLEKEMNHIIKCDASPCVSEHTYEKGILTIPISNNVVDSGSVSEVIGAWDYTPCPEPSLPDVHADGNEVMLVGYFHSGDFPKSFNVDDWNGYTAGEWTPEHSEPSSVWLVGSADDTTSMEFGDI